MPRAKGIQGLVGGRVEAPVLPYPSGGGQRRRGLVASSFLWSAVALDLGLLILGSAQDAQVAFGLLQAGFSLRCSRIWQLGLCAAPLLELHI